MSDVQNVSPSSPQGEERELWAEYRLRVYAYLDTMNLAREDACEAAAHEAFASFTSALREFPDLRVETM